jgi:hypothetical protein
MKKTAAVIAGIFLTVMVAGNALAAMDDDNFAGVSSKEMASVRSMVAGTHVPSAVASPAEKKREVDLGFIKLSETDLDELKDMVAGRYVASPEKSRNPGNDVLNFGRVEMKRQDYELLKAMVQAKLNHNAAPLFSNASTALGN